MNIKKILLISLLLSLVCTLGFSQSAETIESLEEDIKTYVKIVEDKDFASMLDYMPPKFFEKVPKETMMKGMAEAFNNPEVVIDLGEFEVKKIHPLLEVEGGKYTLVDYTFRLNMKMVIPEGEKPEEVKEQMDFTKSMLEMQHGEGSVAHDEETNTFSIDVETSMYALSEPAFEGWKFIEKKENIAPLMGQIMPQAAIDGLK